MPTYVACAIQPTIQPVLPPGRPFCPDAVARNLEHVRSLIRAAHDAVGAELYVLPEFGLQGYVPGRSVEDWISASFSLPGREIDQLAELACELGVFICGMIYEVIEEFPGRYWNTAFLIDDGGTLVLKYRKLYAMTSKTRPGDVLQEWVERFGADSLYPVATTRLGRMAALIARDTHWPEVSRCFALRGAEIMLNPMGALRSADDKVASGADYARMARAYENSVYVVAANFGPFIGVADDLPRARSEILDFRGRRLASGPSGDEGWISAEIDLQALRRHRTTVGANPLAQLQVALHAPVYAAANVFPANGWRDRPLRDASENSEMERRVIGRLIADGVITAPDRPT